MNLKEKKALYKKANDAYNNTGKAIMTDAEFDKLEREIAKADPEWSSLRKTGAKVGKKVEVKLACYMPSLRKVYPEDLPKWLAKQSSMTQLEMHKLDGSALQVEYKNQRPVKVVTRGDGTMGKDISFLIPFLNLPKIPAKERVIFRCEAVMKEALFQSKWSVKKLGDKGFENARGMVNGLLNRTKEHKGMIDIDIVVLGVYSMEMQLGLDWAINQGMTVVSHSMTSLNKIGESRLKSARMKSAYLIDGLVYVAPRQVFDYDSADKPKWITAFKVNDDADAVSATVVDVIWQESRTGRWTPKIEIEPTKMGGVTVTYATAHNAVWMNERRIGVGAVVKIVRSGDVIPKIVGVVKKAKQPSHPPGEFYEKGVHYYNVAASKEAAVREIHHFFSTLGIEHIAQKTVAKLYDAGFTSVLDYLKAFGDTRPFNKIEQGLGLKLEVRATFGMKSMVDAGLGWTMAAKIIANMDTVLVGDGVTLIKMMNASNCFESFGERKLQMVQDHYAAKCEPDSLKHYVKHKFEYLADSRNWDEVISIKGMGSKSAQQFFAGLIEFKKWFAPILKTKLIKVNAPEAKSKKVAKGKYVGQFVSFTGYRSEEQEQALIGQGAEVIKLGAKTTILLYNPKGKFQDKVEKARAKGIKVCTYEELK